MKFEISEDLQLALQEVVVDYFESDMSIEECAEKYAIDEHRLYRLKELITCASVLKDDDGSFWGGVLHKYG